MPSRVHYKEYATPLKTIIGILSNHMLLYKLWNLKWITLVVDVVIGILSNHMLLYKLWNLKWITLVVDVVLSYSVVIFSDLYLKWLKYVRPLGKTEQNQRKYDIGWPFVNRSLMSYSRIAFLQHDKMSRSHYFCVDLAGILCTVSVILLFLVFISSGVSPRGIFR